ncbi:hypothetical protein [Streptomyces griseorubiginosus]
MGEHVCLAGSFNLLRFDDDPDIVCTEDLPDLGSYDGQPRHHPRARPSFR